MRSRVGSEMHRRDQRQVLSAFAHVAVLDLAEASRIGEADRRESIFGVVLVELRQDYSEPAAQPHVDRRLGGGLGERRCEKHDPEIGVEPGRSNAGFRRAQNALPDAQRRIGDWPGRRDGRALEMRNLHAVAGRMPVHVAGLQRLELGAARSNELRR